jgi:hypothetical protein
MKYLAFASFVLVAILLKGTSAAVATSHFNPLPHNFLPKQIESAYVISKYESAYLSIEL